MKLRHIFIVLAATLIVTASVEAQTPPRAHSSVRLTGCDTINHSAQFQGTMVAFGRGTTMQMRFTLQARDPKTRRWARVGADPPFETWLTADPGYNRYVFDAGADNLVVGLAYRVVVRFRFRDAQGEIVARAWRRSKKCRQPDERPDLEPVRLHVGDEVRDGLRSYELTMANNGQSMAPESMAALDVNGVRAPLVSDPGLAAGATTTVSFQAPPCPAGSNLVATVDVTALVDEHDEADNALTVPCPSRR
jgi:hypothetical protein